MQITYYTVTYIKDGEEISTVLDLDGPKTFDEMKALVDALAADEIIYQGFVEE